MSDLPELSWLRRSAGDEDMAWLDDALCAQIGPAVFFPDQGGSSKTAQRICSMCPNTGTDGPCASYALDNHIREGIWGGLSPTDRRKIWRERGIVVPLDDADEDEEMTA